MQIISCRKTRNLSNTDNYRGISLSSTVAKTINRLILNRIQPVLEPRPRPNQNGFRPKRSTNAQILVLRRIIEGVKPKQPKSCIIAIIHRLQKSLCQYPQRQDADNPYCL